MGLGKGYWGMARVEGMWVRYKDPLIPISLRHAEAPAPGKAFGELRPKMGGGFRFSWASGFLRIQF